MVHRQPAARVARRYVVALVTTLVAVLGFARPALAQSIEVYNEASLPRLDKDGKVLLKRDRTLTPEGVNFQDCIDDQKIRFTLQMSGFPTSGPVPNVRAFASINQDCKASTSRPGGTQQQCWALVDSIPTAVTQNVDIPVRKIMAGVNNVSKPDDTEEVCGTVDLATISVQFLYFAPGDPNTAAFAKAVPVTVDTVGPQPPSGLSALPGDTRIKVEWKNISGGSADGGAAAGVTELTGIKVYCDPAGDQTTTTPAAPVCHDEPVTAGTDAGDAGEEGGTDAGEETETVEVCEDGGTSTTTTSSCSSPNFVNADGSPIIPTAAFNAKYQCGENNSNTGTSITARAIGKTPLVNGTQYAVAVAATDAYGNVGKLSPVVCETPEVTTDFWDDYRKAGGRAGDGCATVGGSVPVSSTVVLGLGATLTLSSILRSRRRRKSASDATSPREGSRR